MCNHALAVTLPRPDWFRGLAQQTYHRALVAWSEYGLTSVGPDATEFRTLLERAIRHNLIDDLPGRYFAEKIQTC
jgi:hypothetical protein